MRTFNVERILEEEHIIVKKDTWQGFIWKTVSQFLVSRFSSENQRVAFISTVLWFYSVEVLNLEGLSMSLWVDNVKVH